jgi:hypothetical protein
MRQDQLPVGDAGQGESRLGEAQIPMAQKVLPEHGSTRQTCAQETAVAVRPTAANDAIVKGSNFGTTGPGLCEPSSYHTTSGSIGARPSATNGEDISTGWSGACVSLTTRPSAIHVDAAGRPADLH